jgi:hypothetical protein
VNAELAQRFVALYEQLDRHSIERLGEIYTEDIVFVDPFHRLEGLLALQQYMRGLYQDITNIHFACAAPSVATAEAYVRWTLSVTHPRLAGGRPIAVPGVSFLRGDSKIFYHEDFYDGGALLYEHVPILGAGVRFLKRRMQGEDALE